jgi:ceramide glucosyltransferase
MVWLSYLSAIAAILGLMQSALGWFLTTRFVTSPHISARARTPVTVLKPLYGDEPMLEAALSSFCRQNGWPCQIVFGVQNAVDPALAVVRLVQARFPDADIAVVIDPTQHGPNRKVGNLINMLPSARHDVLVIADSDLHVRPDYLERLVATLEQPGCGLVTTLYAGMPATSRLSGALGAMAITHYFLPGALLARLMGRQDCLGATMALRRDTLDRIGGLEALVDYLADDHVLGRGVRSLGLDIRIARTVPATTVPETRLCQLYSHELRWARTIRALEPAGFAGSILQFSIAWAALALVFSAGATWAVLLLAMAWIVRAMAAAGIDRALAPFLPGLAFRASFWLLPLRELMSVVVMLASYGGDSVDWRGHTMHADGHVPPQPRSGRPRVAPEGMNLP